jgi:hypothetical protein
MISLGYTVTEEAEEVCYIDIADGTTFEGEAVVCPSTCS